jgi:hypothetical protein
VAIPLTSPLYVWDDMASYLNYVTNNEQTFQNPARFAMLLFGPLFVVLLRSIHDLAPHEKRPLTRIALCFGLAVAALTGINYFVQLTAFRLSILRGETEGLEQIVQANPFSAISAINVLGWTLFFSLSS